MEVPLKTKPALPHDPASPFLGIYPEKTIIIKGICTLMFTAALFTIVRMWKRPECPSTKQWVRKMCGII